MLLRQTAPLLCASFIVFSKGAWSQDCPKRLRRDSSYGYTYQYGGNQVISTPTPLPNPHNLLGDSNEEVLSRSSFDPLFDGNAQNVGDIAGAGAAGKQFAQTGLNAKLVDSFTVTDLALFVDPTSDPATVESKAAEATAASISSEATGSPSASQPTSTPPPSASVSLTFAGDASSRSISGVNAKVISSFTAGATALPVTTASAGDALPATSSDTIAISEDSASVGGDGERSSQTELASGVTPAAESSSASVGINAAQRGFVFATTSIDIAAIASQASLPGTSSPADVTEASHDEPQGVQIPGQKLSVLPIGLGVFGGLALLGLIVVGFVTYERRQYRKQFRERKAREIAQNLMVMRQSILRRRM